MDSRVFCLQSKFKRLLYKFLEGRCPSGIDRHFDSFFFLLRTQEEADVESTLRALPIFTEWLKEATITWSSTKARIPPTIVAFSLNLAGFLSRIEHRFCQLNTNNFYIKLINVSKARQADSATCVKLGYVRLLSSFLEHKSGLEWMVASSFWEDIYKLSVSDSELVEESTGFMSKLLERTMVADENFCDDVIKKLMVPLGENVYKSLKTSSDGHVSEEVAAKCLKPTLRLLGNILEHFLQAVYFQKGGYDVLFLFLENFHLEERLSDLMVLAQSKCLVFDLGKIMFVMQFLELYVKTLTKSAAVAKINSSVERMKSNFITSISNGDFYSIFEFCKFGILFWRLVDSKFPCSDNEKKDLGTQLYFMLGIPSLFLMVKYYMSWSEYEEIESVDDIRNIYMQKSMNMISPDIVRLFYSWRDNLQSRPNLFNLHYQCVDYLKEQLPYLNKNEAVLCCQDYTYGIKDAVAVFNDKPEKIEIFLKEQTFFALHFEMTILLIEKFEITWKDSVEAIELLDLSFEFLRLADWSAELVVQVLKLINVAIVKYMSPNLALLVENPTDSVMDVLGTLVSEKLECKEVEVKKSVLEICCTMARLSRKSKFTLQLH